MAARSMTGASLLIASWAAPRKVGTLADLAVVKVKPAETASTKRLSESSRSRFLTPTKRNKPKTSPKRERMQKRELKAVRMPWHKLKRSTQV